MKTSKLAFSVYALTLALATNGAWAAGSASPSCEANTFKIIYDLNNCSNGYFVGGSAPANITTEQTWGGSFTALSSDTATGGKNCLGYEVERWTAAALQNWLIPGTTYTNNTTTWKSAPSANGSTDWTVKATYVATENDITFDDRGADVASKPTYVTRKGINIINCTGANSQCHRNITSSENGILDLDGANLPVKYGYTFKGYYQNEARATVIGNAWNNSGSVGTYTAGYCKNNSASETKEAWAKDGSEFAANCPWIGEDGYLGNDHVGIAAAKLGTTTLYAAWEPKAVAIAFAAGGRSNMADLAKPVAQNVTNMPTGTTCRFEQAGSCGTLSTLPETTDGLYDFVGFKVTAGSVDYGTITAAQIQAGYDLSTVLQKAMFEKNGNTTSSVTLTALWSQQSTVINFYASKDATTSFLTAQARISNANSGGGSKVVTFYDMEGKQMTTGPVLAGIPSDQVPANSTLRGFVFKIAGAPDAVMATVNTDAAALPTTYSTGNNMHLLSNNVGTLQTGTEVANAIEGIQTDDAINAYAVWAQNCDDAATLQSHHVATCELNIGTDGSVTYVNTCDTGYNIEGVNKVN